MLYLLYYMLLYYYYYYYDILPLYYISYININMYIYNIRIRQKISMLSSIPHLLSILTFCLLLKLSKQQAQDTYTAYMNVQATAMDIQYTSNTVVLADINKNIVQYPAIAGVAVKTIATSHRTSISSLAISPDKSKVLSGGSDFTANIYDLSTGNVLCAFNQLYGNIISSRIGSDNNMYAFASNQGYLYYGDITGCTINKYKYSPCHIKSVQIVLSITTIFATDYNTGILALNYNTNVSTTITLPTSRTVTIRDLTAASKLAVCTQQAFYLLSYSGAVVFTLPSPALYTRKCRITSGWASVTGQYYLTAVNQQLSYNNSGSITYPLWNIWKIDTVNLVAYLHHQQLNSGNRYSASSTKVKDAGCFLVSKQQILVTSIAQTYNPYYNYFQDTGIASCTTGFYVNVGCEKCNYDTANRPFCKQCSGGGQCQKCVAYTYFVSTTKKCMPCESNCYFCTSATACTSCVGGYTLANGDCIANNITGCMNSFWSNPVSYCTDCMLNYMPQFSLSCKQCNTVYGNCSQCTSNGCTKCDPHFILGSLNICEICSYVIEGCSQCLNQTYCQTCYQDYPYFDYPSSNTRICKKYCGLSCLTCNHYNYTTCTSCDSNRTMTNLSTCVCLATYPMYNSITNKCQACVDYLSNCINCTNTTYCVQCNNGMYFDDTVIGYQTCRICNYTCLTCTNYWYNCTTCDANVYRVLSDKNTCVCQSVAYFQMPAPQLPCQLCSNWITNCDVCFNKTYCVTCVSGYYVKTISTTTTTCEVCTLPCLQCFGTATNCTDCNSGRVLNSTSGTCMCLTGYYPDTATTCAPCSPLLGSCLSCNTNSTCLSCWTNAYFKMGTANGVAAKICDLCQVTCLTCSVWYNICATCDALANRVLNTVTKQCDCMTGYTETAGRCLNCTATFQYCTGCNATTCFSCAPGYSLAYGGLKCVQCQATYPGCVLCLNGVCAGCNATAGYELAYSKCICQPGYYQKSYECFPYAYGSGLKRSFEGYATYSQDMNSSEISISIYFRCQGIKLPHGIQNSVNITINDIVISSYNVYQSNTTLVFTFPPPNDISKSLITIQFLNNTVYDLDEYQPKNRIFTFNKNIYFQAKYQLASTFSTVYQNMIILVIRWIVSILTLLGCADFVLLLVFTVHFVPAFLLLGLSLPMPLQYVLQTMISINYKSLFAFADFNIKLQPYQDNTLYATHSKIFNASGGLVYNKLADLIFLSCLLVFYGILCPKLTPLLPQGKLKKLWQYKFNLKKYSTLSNTILCFMPTFLTCTIFDLRIQQYNPNLQLTIGLSIIILAISASFIFFHASVLHTTQFNDEHKNQDCYFGSSTLDHKSIPFILSLLIIVICAIPLLGLTGGIYCIPIISVIILWHISYFRFWVNFPNKILYFLKICWSVLLLVYVVSFLLFTISQQYKQVPISTIQLLSLITLVNIIILFSLSVLQCLILFIHNFYKQCKIHANLVQNIQEEKQKQQLPSQQATNQQQSIMNIRILSKRKLQDSYNQTKLTNKQQHMARFRQQHLRQTTNMFKQRTEQMISSKGMSTNGFKKQR